MYRVNFADITLKFPFQKDFNVKSLPQAKIFIEDNPGDFFTHKNNNEKILLDFLDIELGIETEFLSDILQKLPEKSKTLFLQNYTKFRTAQNRPYYLLEIETEETVLAYKTIWFIFIDSNFAGGENLKPYIYRAVIECVNKSQKYFEEEEDVKLHIDIENIISRIELIFDQQELLKLGSDKERKIMSCIMLLTEIINSIYFEPPVSELTVLIPEQHYGDTTTNVLKLTSKSKVKELANPTREQVFLYLFKYQYFGDIKQLVYKIKTEISDLQKYLSKNRKDFYEVYLCSNDSEGWVEGESKRHILNIYGLSDNPDQDWVEDLARIDKLKEDYQEAKKEYGLRKKELKKWLSIAAKEKTSMKEKISETRLKAENKSKSLEVILTRLENRLRELPKEIDKILYERMVDSLISFLDKNDELTFYPKIITKIDREFVYNMLTRA